MVTIQSENRMSVDIPATATAGVLCVRIAGVVDLGDKQELALAGPRIRGPGARTVFLDVGSVTFFGTTLVNFLVHLANSAPGGQVVLCRPSPMARRIIAALPLPPQISARPDLPPDWVEPPSARQRDGGRVSRAAS